MLLLGLALYGEAPAEDLLVRVSLASGKQMEGERIEYQNGQFRLFRSGKPHPLTIPFGEVRKVTFIRKGAELEPAPAEPPQADPPKGRKDPRPYKLPLREIGALTGEEFEALEKELLFARGPAPFDFLMNLGKLVNHLIAEGKLEEVAAQYEQKIHQAKFRSRAEVRLRLLCVACLERLGEKERLDLQVKELRERYRDDPHVLGLDHLLEKLSSGDLRPRWPRRGIRN